MGFPDITNHMVPILGTSTVAHLTHYNESNKWTYTLWDSNNALIGGNTIDFIDMYVSPDQVARIAFLLEVEYPT